MEKTMLVRPQKEHEKQAIEFITECRENKSQIEGVNGLHKYLENYDGWLEKIEQERHNITDDKNVPTETLFLIRVSDGKILGMATLRMELNKRYSNFGGNIGYTIRPTERQKGYAKQLLYGSLQLFKEYGTENIMLDCDKSNIGSAKTIQALGGILTKETKIEDLECIKQDYKIDVDKSIEIFAPLYTEVLVENNRIEQLRK